MLRLIVVLTMAENHPATPFGVGPRNCSGRVTDHVAGAAFEALFVVEKNATIVGSYEQFRRAGRDTRFGRAASTNFAIHGDVRLVRNSEIDCLHPVFKTDWCAPTHSITLERALALRRFG